MNEDTFIHDFVSTLQFDNTVVVPPGDDCAALDLGGEELLLAAVDQVAAETHYFGPDADHPASPEAVGRKVLARNLSDIAAMGGTPRYALVASAFPQGVDAERPRAIAEGLLKLAQEYDVQIVGGDVGRAGSEVISLTILGSVSRDRICLRQAARPGDVILVTGEFGASLETGRHLNFKPRITEAQWLVDNGCRCMIDVSDGLLQDLLRLCRASGVAAEIDQCKVPAVATLEQALYDGEDYELIAVLPCDDPDELRARWPFDCRLTPIGHIENGSPRVVGYDGTAFSCPGFEHFD